MRSLFVKIFLWLWGSIILAVVSGSLLASFALQPVRNAQRGSGELLLRSAEQKLAEFQNSRSCGISADSGHFLFAFENSKQCYGPPAPPEIIELMAAAERNGKIAGTTLDAELVARRAISGAHSWTVILGSLSPTEIGNRSLLLRMLGLIGILTIACVWMAHHIAWPVEQIRGATRRFAAGNLQARINGPLSKRADVIGHLAANFDEMADRIERLIASQTQLLNDVSHELRSPLARLTIACGLARRGGTETAQALDRIDSEAEHLNRLIEQLLMLARLNSADLKSQQLARSNSLRSSRTLLTMPNSKRKHTAGKWSVSASANASLQETANCCAARSKTSFATRFAIPGPEQQSNSAFAVPTTL